MVGSTFSSRMPRSSSVVACSACRCTVKDILCICLVLLTCPSAISSDAEEDASFPARVGRLQAWIEAHGGSISWKVKAVEDALGKDVAATGGNRGLIASTYIMSGEVLIQVPAAAMLSHTTVVTSTFGTDVRDALLEWKQQCSACSMAVESCKRLCAHVGLECEEDTIRQIEAVIWLAKERQNQTSDWRPWLDLLPSDFSSAPIALPEPMLRAAYDGTEVLERVLTMRAMWRATHNVLSNSSATYQKYVGSYDAFVAARLLVTSREHGLRGGGGGGIGGDALVPYADLLNHQDDAPTWWGPSASGGFELKAIEQIPASAAITCRYGVNRSNWEMISQYGFMPGGNAAHSVELALSIEEDALYSVKRDILLEMDLYRTYRFGADLGFAASGSPLRPPEAGWKQLSESEQKDLMMTEAMTFLRVAVLEVSDIDADPDAKDSFYQVDEAAIERFRARGAVTSAKVEMRVAERLETICSEHSRKLAGGMEDSRAIEGALRVAEPSTADALDVGSVASTAAVYLASERGPYEQLRCLARTAKQMIQKETWPHNAEAAAREAGCGSASEHLDRWARSYLGSGHHSQEL